MNFEKTPDLTLPRANWNRLLLLFDDVPSRTLLQVLHHGSPEKEGAVALLLSLARTGLWLQAEIRAILAELGLTENAFGVYLVLYTVDPVPITAADLAYRIGVSRANVSAVLRQMEKSGGISRQRLPGGRGAKEVSLTDAGRIAAREALKPFLEKLAAIAHGLPVADQVVLANACAGLRRLETRTSSHNHTAMRDGAEER